MIFELFRQLDEEELWLVLGILIILSISLFVMLIYQVFIKKTTTFRDVLKNYKNIQMSIAIDLEEKVVEKYYLYDQSHKNQKISLDEFYLKFDQANKKRLVDWISHIQTVTDFTKTRRQEFVMYDDNNRKRIYRVELESYDVEKNKFFFIFRDITESMAVFKRLERIVNVNDIEKFYDKVKEYLLASDEDSLNYLVAIRYKEFFNLEKDVRGDAISLIDSNVYSRLAQEKFENDLICQFNPGIVLMFSANISNVKKYKRHVRQIIYKNSGQYDIAKNRFNITLVAGLTKVTKEDMALTDKVLEAELSVNQMINRFKLSDRLQFYDEDLKKKQTEKAAKMLLVQNIITENLFIVNYQPVIEKKSKKVTGYIVDLQIPSNLKLDKEEFYTLAKEIGFRKTFFIKVFERIIAHPEAKTKSFYFCVEYDNFTRAMDAYQTDNRFAKVDFIFCIGFKNTKKYYLDLLQIEKEMNLYRRDLKIRLGINYNALQTIYLNDKIYSKVDLLLLSGQLVDQSLQTYSNRTLIDIYSKVAKEYTLDLVAADISSLDLYEMFKNYNFTKFSGPILTSKIINGEINDKSTLKILKEIEEKKY